MHRSLSEVNLSKLHQNRPKKKSGPEQSCPASRGCGFSPVNVWTPQKITERLPHPAPAPAPVPVPVRLTHAGVSVLFESGGAHAPPDGHQPLPFGAAVHFGCVSLFGVVHALTSDLHQGGGVGARHHVGEHRQVAADSHAAFVVHPHGGEGDAGADVLEGQVEAALVEGADAAHLGGGGTAQGSKVTGIS